MRLVVFIISTSLFLALSTFTGVSTTGCSNGSSPLPDEIQDIEKSLSIPTNLTATPGERQITLSWDSVEGATGYIIYWTTNSEEPGHYPIQGVTSPYGHKGLTGGVTYYYRLVAFNEQGRSNQSKQVSAVAEGAGEGGGYCGDEACSDEETVETCEADCPAICNDGTCTHEETAVSCPDDCDAVCGDGDCTHEETPESCPTDCPVTCGDGACTHDEWAGRCPVDCPAVVGDGACTHDEDVETSLADCTICDDGACTHEETAALCPEDCPSECGDGACTHEENAATCGDDCSVDHDDGSCTHDEDAASDEACPVTCGDGACTHDETARSCSDDCDESCGDGACTHDETVRTCPGDCPPEAPTIINAIPRDGGATIEWEAVTGASSYKVYRKLEGERRSRDITNTGGLGRFSIGGRFFFKDIRLTNGETYCYYVRAKGVRMSQLSRPRCVTPQFGLGWSVKGVRVAPLSQRDLRITWDRVDRDRHLGTVGYRVYFSIDPEASAEEIADTDPIQEMRNLGLNGYTHRGRSIGETYSYVVTAIDERGHESDPSTIARGRPYLFRTRNSPNTVEVGRSVAISGNYAIVGLARVVCEAEDELCRGKAYIYEHGSESGWNRTRLSAFGPERDDHFGLSVAIDGNWAIVGAPGDDDGEIDSGAVYVYKHVRRGIFGRRYRWRRQIKLKAPGIAFGARCGESVAIKGDLVVVGCPYERDQTGIAYVYNLDTRRKYFIGGRLGKERGDRFGTSVSVSQSDEETFVIVGSPYAGGRNEDGTSVNAGEVDIFRLREGASTVHETRIEGRQGSRFGYSVSIDGSKAVIGAPTEGETGEAHVYRRVGSSEWELEVQLSEAAEFLAPESNLANFGDAVAIHGNKIVIGAPSWRRATGIAYIFTRDLDRWERFMRLREVSTREQGHFGSSVDTTENFTIIGALNSHLDDGFAYIH